MQTIDATPNPTQLHLLSMKKLMLLVIKERKIR